MEAKPQRSVIYTWFNKLKKKIFVTNILIYYIIGHKLVFLRNSHLPIIKGRRSF